VVPPGWRKLLYAGESARVRASVRGGEADGEVELVARLEFTDEGRLAIEVALAETPPRGTPEESLAHHLTARERSVIALIAMGRETHEIAEELHLAASTIRTHVRNSMAKLGAHTRAQLVAVAMAGNALDLSIDPSGRRR
jgi:DNA-binding NarL/FixJ family response regulator